MKTVPLNSLPRRRRRKMYFSNMCFTQTTIFCEIAVEE